MERIDFKYISARVMTVRHNPHLQRKPNRKAEGF
jgi:hypothetical protein